MEEYHKIQTVFKRDPVTNYKTLLEGQWSLPEFEYLQDNLWDFTEKVDGTNIRVIYSPAFNSLQFKGKTDDAQVPKFLLAKLQSIFNPLKDKLADLFPYGVTFYGEGYGARIQKGGGNYIKDGVSFVLFDVKVARWWFQRYDVHDIACDLDLDVVPFLNTGNLHEMVDLVKSKPPSIWGPFEAEGIVARPKVELVGRDGKRIITKLKVKDFLQNEPKRPFTERQGPVKDFTEKVDKYFV